MIPTRRIVLLGLLAAPLAACNAPPIQPSDFPAFGEVKARFVKGDDLAVIEVRSLSSRALAQATLVLADGSRVEAYSIETERDPRVSGFASANPAAGFAEPPLAGSVAFPPGGTPGTTTTFIGQIAATALIRVPDLDAYRLDWAKARIDVRLGLGPDARLQTVAAPTPL